MSKVKQLKQRAQGHVQKQNWDKAIAEYKKILDLEPNDPNFPNELGDIFIRKGDKVQACKYFEESLEAYKKVQLFNNAVAVCKKILRVAPNRLNVHWTLGEIRANQGIKAEASQHFCKFLELAMVDASIGEAELLEKCEAILGHLPENASVLAKMVDLYIKFEKNEKAAKVLEVLADQALRKGDEEKAAFYADRANELGGIVAPDSALGEEEESTEHETLGIELPNITGDAGTDESVVAGEIPQGRTSADNAPTIELGSPAAGGGTPSGTREEIELPSMGGYEESIPPDAPEVPVGSGSTSGNVELREVSVSQPSPGEIVNGPDLSTRAQRDDAEEEPSFQADPNEIEFDELPARRMTEAVDSGSEPAGKTASHGGVATVIGSPGDEGSTPPGPPRFDDETDHVSGELGGDLNSFEIDDEEPSPDADWSGEVEAHSIPDPTETGGRSEAHSTATTDHPRPSAQPPESSRVSTHFDMGSAPDHEAREEANEPREQYTATPTSVLEDPPESAGARGAADVGDPPIQVFSDVTVGADGKIDYKSHYDMGMAYLEMRLYTEAVKELQIAAQDPNWRLRCIEMIGFCFLEQGQPKLAVKQLKRGLEFKPEAERDHLGIHYNLGLAYETLGDLEQAREHYEEVYVVDLTFRDIQDRLNRLG